jgi:hypothetical protein
MPIEKACAKMIVTIRKDGCCDDDLIAQDAPYGITSTIYLRLYCFNYDPAPTLGRLHPNQLSVVKCIHPTIVL